MTTAALSEDIALRIGLAARLLEDVSPAQVLQVLADSIGLPPTADKLATLRIKDLKNAHQGLLGDYDPALLKDALAVLKGEASQEQQIAPPAVKPYTEGDLPHSIRVACASNNGEMLDGHFGSCLRFLIYQVAADGLRLIEYRDTSDLPAGADKNEARAALISDCQLLYVVSIGGPAAAKVVKRGIHPIKQPEGGEARVLMRQLQTTLNTKAPPWLAKILAH